MTAATYDAAGGQPHGERLVQTRRARRGGAVRAPGGGGGTREGRAAAAARQEPEVGRRAVPVAGVRDPVRAGAEAAAVGGHSALRVVVGAVVGRVEAVAAGEVAAARARVEVGLDVPPHLGVGYDVA